MSLNGTYFNNLQHSFPYVRTGKVNFFLSFSCGMVYYDPQDLGWRPYLKSWMQKVGDKFKQETQVELFILLLRFIKYGIHVYTGNIFPSCFDHVTHTSALPPSFFILGQFFQNEYKIVLIDKCIFIIYDFFFFFLQDHIMNLFETYIDSGLQFAQKKCIQAIPQVC